MLSLNTHLASLPASAIRAITATAQQHPDCALLTLGEPGEDTPAAIVTAAHEALLAGHTHYPPNAGIPELRAALADYEAARGLAGISAAEKTLITCGATEALSTIFATLLNPGDEVIIPTPAFGLYQQLALLNGAQVLELPTEHDEFQLSRAMLEKVISPATKLIVLCSPGNPTGAVADAQTLDALAEVALAHDIFIVCDEVYLELFYNKRAERFLERHPECADRCFVVGSFSKPWAMTGWRLGWFMAPDAYVAATQKVHQSLVSCASAATQYAGLAALSVDVEPLRAVYAKRRQQTLDTLGKAGLDVVEPAGAFYAFPRLSGLQLSSQEFAERAIKEAGVAVVPGNAFGCEGHIRISYAASDAELAKGLERLCAFVDKLRRA